MHIDTEMHLVFTCCGGQKNSTRGSDLETACLVAVASTGSALMAFVSDFVEGWEGRSKDDTLPSPEKEMNSISIYIIESQCFVSVSILYSFIRSQLIFFWKMI